MDDPADRMMNATFNSIHDHPNQPISRRHIRRTNRASNLPPSVLNAHHPRSRGNRRGINVSRHRSSPSFQPSNSDLIDMHRAQQAGHHIAAFSMYSIQ